MKPKKIVQLEKWVNNGYTLGHYDGKPIFVLGGIPGEEVECTTLEENKKITSAIVTHIRNPSTSRIRPPCPIYLECGGCFFQHISYPEELRIKEDLLRIGLQYSGIKFEKVPILIHSGNEYNYRNNVQLKRMNSTVGFFKIKTNEIVSLPDAGCLILEDKLNNFIRDKSNSIPPDGKLRIDNSGVYPYGQRSGTFHIQANTIEIPANGFYQINSSLLEIWIDRILYYSESKKDILELFCGSGTISLFLAGLHNQIAGFELSEDSIQFAKKNLKNFSNVSFYRRDLYTQSLPVVFQNDHICIANPPRAGLGNLVKKHILNSKPSKIIYSSCNYTTLLPDLKDLKTLYRIVGLEILDFFPKTPYFETLVILEKNE